MPPLELEEELLELEDVFVIPDELDDELDEELELELEDELELLGVLPLELEGFFESELLQPVSSRIKPVAIKTCLSIRTLSFRILL